jgi:rod shape-determining protein MreD
MEPPGRPGPCPGGSGGSGLKREAGRWPRALGTAVMGLLLAVLGTTAFTWWAVGPLRLEPLIVLVVSAGYRLPLVLGFVVVMFLGYVADLISGGVMGLSMVIFTLIYVICQLARRKLDIASWPFQMLSVGVLTVVAHLLTAGGVTLTVPSYVPPVNLPLLLVAQALINALTAPLFFGLNEALVNMLARLWPAQRKATP